MVLPPYVYQGSWREMEAHFTAVISATELPCMLYNNPIAYGHDVSDAPTPYGCRPEDIDRLIRLAKAANLDIQPVAAAWRMATA